MSSFHEKCEKKKKKLNNIYLINHTGNLEQTVLKYINFSASEDTKLVILQWLVDGIMNINNYNEM